MSNLKKVQADNLNQPEVKRDLMKEIEDMQLFMYALIHDLKAPISNLNAIFSLIKDENITDKPILMEKAETVVHSMDHTIEKLNKLLVFKDGIREDVKVLELTAVFKELLESEIAGNISEVSFKCNFKDCQQVVYSETYLKCILSNLVNNAVKYQSPKRSLQVHLCSQRLGDKVLLTVRDNGEGINMSEEGMNLFKPFKRLSNSKEGSRLGLYLVKVLVEKNGGYLVIDSTPNVGSIFTLYLSEYSV
jgi:signal transduction histidine kinase